VRRRSENFITVLTPAVYDYQYLPEVAVGRKSHVTFRVRAGADAHVALSTMYGETDRKTYELVLGGWTNRRTALRYGGRGPVMAGVDTPRLLDVDEFRPFWISWTDDVIQVARRLSSWNSTRPTLTPTSSRGSSRECLRACRPFSLPRNNWQSAAVVLPVCSSRTRRLVRRLVRHARFSSRGSWRECPLGMRACTRVNVYACTRVNVYCTR